MAIVTASPSRQENPTSRGEPSRCRGDRNSSSLLGHRDAVIGGLEPVSVAARIGFALALLVDDLRLGLGQKAGVVELRGHFGELGIEPAQFLGEARLLAAEIDNLAETQDQGRTLDDGRDTASRHRLYR